MLCSPGISHFQKVMPGMLSTLFFIQGMPHSASTAVRMIQGIHALITMSLLWPCPALLRWASS